jgi:hypothetical protein
MAVVNLFSSQLTNAYATPVVLSNPYQAGGGDIVETAVIASGASDSAGSIYRYFRIPSNARIQDIALMNETANTSGTSYKCGVYSVAVGGGAVPVANADQIFFNAVSMVTTRTVWTSVYSPSILAGGVAAANTGLRVWELLNLTADPFVLYDVGIAAVTPGSVGTNMALQLSYVR